MKFYILVLLYTSLHHYPKVVHFYETFYKLKWCRVKSFPTSSKVVYTTSLKKKCFYCLAGVTQRMTVKP